MLVAGWSNYEFAVARFTSGGSLDSSFGSAGLVKMNLNPTGSKAAGLIVLPTGKILVSGYGEGTTIFRLNENGTPDSAFGGGDGVVTPTFSYPCCISSSAVAMTIDELGRIVIVGDHDVGTENNPFLDDWAIARLWSDGVPDPSFGDDGLTLNPFEGSAFSDYATSVVFYVCLVSGDIWAALGGALAWCYGAMAWRVGTRRRCSGLLAISFIQAGVSRAD